MFSRKIQSLCIALFWLCVAVPQMAFAEYPEHPVTVYHPFQPVTVHVEAGGRWLPYSSG